jgi:O-methyltransferase
VSRLDLTVYPGSRIERLPRPLQLPMLLMRALVFPGGRPGFLYQGDGMGTNHFGPFTQDPEFEALYQEVSGFWEAPTKTDMRWRLWLLTRLARMCRHVPGDYAEFGTYRGGTALMVLTTARIPAGKRLWLFDTFRGIPDARLTPRERADGFAGTWSEGAGASGVRARLERWADQVEIREGDVFETLPAAAPPVLAFVHLDLNASAATAHVLEHVFPRLSAGGIVVFDDYGWDEYVDQRKVIDEYFAERPEDVVALPTGQAFVVAA